MPPRKIDIVAPRAKAKNKSTRPLRSALDMKICNRSVNKYANRRQMLAMARISACVLPMIVSAAGERNALPRNHASDSMRPRTAAFAIAKMLVGVGVAPFVFIDPPKLKIVAATPRALYCADECQTMLRALREP